MFVARVDLFLFSLPRKWCNAASLHVNLCCPYTVCVRHVAARAFESSLKLSAPLLPFSFLSSFRDLHLLSCKFTTTDRVYIAKTLDRIGVDYIGT